MYGVLVALLVLDGILLTIIVLLQAGKGGGLAAMGGSGGTAADTLIGGRQAATLLTKATWIAGAIFLSLAMLLSVLSSRAAMPESILQQEFQTTPSPQPLLPGTQPEAGAPPDTLAPAPTDSVPADTAATQPAEPGGGAQEPPDTGTGTGS
ncbi:MAG: preprotein translocase subunit SecG [Longimicrobiales bacterium]